MDVDLIRREILVLSRLDHPNIMKFFGASVVLPNICIVSEYLERGKCARVVLFFLFFLFPLSFSLYASHVNATPFPFSITFLSFFFFLALT